MLWEDVAKPDGADRDEEEVYGLRVGPGLPQHVHPGSQQDVDQRDT